MRTEIYIEVTKPQNAEVLLDSRPEENNVSNTDMILSGVSTGFKGFQLSPSYDKVVSTLDGTFKLFDRTGYKGYISSYISSVDNFDEPMFAFTARGNVDTLFITYDLTTQEFARRVRVYAGDGTVTFVFDEWQSLYVLDVSQLNIHEDTIFFVEFVDWSALHSSFKITRISTILNITLTENEIVSIECSENSYDTNVSITPGLIEQYADIVFYDRYGMFKQLANIDMLPEGGDVKISAVDEIDHSLGSYKVSAWDIQGDSSEIGLTCNDSTHNLDETFLQPTSIADRTIDDMLTMVFSQANNASWRYANVITETLCKNVCTPNHWFERDTLKRTLIKICLLGLLHIYVHNNTYIISTEVAPIYG